MRGMAGSNGTGGVALRILLVDDHRDTRDVLRQLLTARGHRVTCAGSVGDALRSGDESDYDVLLCDIGLPDGTGYDIARNMSTVPAIAMSAYDSLDDIERSRSAGFYTHLIKPISIENLIALLDAL